MYQQFGMRKCLPSAATAHNWENRPFCGLLPRNNICSWERNIFKEYYFALTSLSSQDRTSSLKFEDENMDNAIKLLDPAKDYGDFLIVNHINFEVPQSEVFD